MISVDTTFASPSATRPVSGAILTKNMKYVNNNSHYFITIICVEFHSYIYVLTTFFKLDVSDAGWTPTTRSHRSNSRGNGGILSWRRHRQTRRIPCGSWVQMLGDVRYIILYNICSQYHRIDIQKLVVRPIYRRRRGRSLLSVYMFMTIFCT